MAGTAGRLLALLGLLLLAAGCDGNVPASGPDASTVTDVAPATVTLSASPTAAPTFAPTKTPPPTATLPALPTIQPTPCSYTTLPALELAYLAIELGCPLTPGRDPIATAYAPFEGGQMLWREDNAVIYVLTNDGRWAQYDDYSIVPGHCHLTCLWIARISPTTANSSLQSKTG